MGALDNCAAPPGTGAASPAPRAARRRLARVTRASAFGDTPECHSSAGDTWGPWTTARRLQEQVQHLQCRAQPAAVWQAMPVLSIGGDTHERASEAQVTEQKILSAVRHALLAVQTGRDPARRLLTSSLHAKHCLAQSDAHTLSQNCADCAEGDTPNARTIWQAPWQHPMSQAPQECARHPSPAQSSPMAMPTQGS